MFNRLGEHLARRSIECESSFVDDERLARWVRRRDALLMLLLAVAFVVRFTCDVESIARVVADLYICFLAGLAGVGGARRAAAYRSGWINGRARMVIALEESARRRMSFDEWLTGELERDARLLGLSTAARPSEDE